MKYLFMKQRISIIKTCLNNTLYYYLRCLSTTNNDFKLIKNAIHKYMWALKNDRISVLIIHEQATRSITKENLNVINIKIMKHALSLFWIFKLKQTISLIEQFASVQTIKEIILHDYLDTIKKKLIKSWTQMWNARSHKLLSSINHFWSYWIRVYKNNQALSINQTKLNSIMFWYHSQLNLDKVSFKWKADIWTKLFDETHIFELILKINQLIKINNDKTRVSMNVKIVVQRLITKFSANWLQIMRNNAINIETKIKVEIYNKKTQSTIMLDNDNRIIYEHLLTDIYLCEIWWVK